jgi:hypothetical protein
MAMGNELTIPETLRVCPRCEEMVAQAGPCPLCDQLEREARAWVRQLVNDGVVRLMFCEDALETPAGRVFCQEARLHFHLLRVARMCARTPHVPTRPTRLERWRSSLRRGGNVLGWICAAVVALALLARWAGAMR